MRTNDADAPATSTPDAREGTPHRRALLVGAAALACAGVTAGARPARGAQEGDAASGATRPATAPRLVVLVRHAETAEGGHGDPELSEAGRARAERLAALFAKSAPALLVSTEYRRTKDTLAPLAAAAGVEVEVQSARDPKQCVARLAGLPAGSLAVVCGHSNTVPDLARRLGVELADLEPGPAGAQFAHQDHGRIVVCALGDGAPPAAFELRY